MNVRGHFKATKTGRYQSGLDTWEFIPAINIDTSEPIVIDRPISLNWHPASKMGGLLRLEAKIRDEIHRNHVLNSHAAFMVAVRALMLCYEEVEKQGWKQEFAAVARSNQPIPKNRALTR